jgi:CheY-like chemotaxis protein
MAEEILRGPRIGVPGGPQAIRPSLRLEDDLTEEEKTFFAGIIGEPKEPPAREDNKPVALVVDDEPRLRGIAKEALEGIGLRVFEARDGVDALKQYASRTTDLIFLELNLPQMDGYKLIRAVRSYCKNMKCVIGVVGYRDDTRDEISALNLGADDYMLKPFTVDRIRARVRSVFRSRKFGL